MPILGFIGLSVLKLGRGMWQTDGHRPSFHHVLSLRRRGILNQWSSVADVSVLLYCRRGGWTWRRWRSGRASWRRRLCTRSATTRSGWSSPSPSSATSSSVTRSLPARSADAGEPSPWSSPCSPPSSLSICISSGLSSSVTFRYGNWRHLASEFSPECECELTKTRTIMGVASGCPRVLVPSTGTFNPKSKTMPLLWYLKVIPYAKFEHFGIIRFWVMLWLNKQTDRQTDGLERSTHADRRSWSG